MSRHAKAAGSPDVLQHRSMEELSQGLGSWEMTCERKRGDLVIFRANGARNSPGDLVLRGAGVRAVIPGCDPGGAPDPGGDAGLPVIPVFQESQTCWGPVVPVSGSASDPRGDPGVLTLGCG